MFNRRCFLANSSIFKNRVIHKSEIQMRNVVLLGSTGSIGTSTIKVAEDLPEKIRLVGLAAGNNIKLLAEQTRKHQPKAISIFDLGKAKQLESTVPAGTIIYSGNEGLLKLATLPEADIVLIAIVGTAGLQPALAAIRAGKDIAVASKEILVMAGEIVMSEARKHGVRGSGRGQRTLGDFPMSRGQAAEFGSQSLADRIGRTVSHDTEGGFSKYHGRTGAQTSVLGHGAKDHDRFRHAL